ncbi:SDR family NAD(P)-dependent oxidoreductase [Bauldia litoralis]|uniref:Short-chain dehydrogenase n=1 Tax=Bauldia litoralis TaxID=665467 RepID=A0A1G6DJW7_9HYPH|nr:SDR family NAD(P)-dependent oxidoreductase [Bauldia litoralis]SDB45487.1 Short-chain dehydrogenase [Bauldia litoralis]
MANHPALQAGRAAVITGGASGIGLAAAKRFAGLGMKIAIADLDPSALDAAAAVIDEATPGGDVQVITVPCDVSRMEEVQALRERAYDAFGDVAVLMNNAGTAPGGGPFDHYDRWQRVIGVNLWGVINGVHAFTPAMIGQGTDAMIVNTGSKQGITCPPGDTAYNVSKAGVKVLTEGLQHELRNTEGCRVSAHLLVPGWTHTAMTAGGATEKPDGAWWPDQVIDLLLEASGKGDFYIICPDNDVTREVDAKRIVWAAGDIAENRVPLSRWHPDYKEAFADYLKR